MMNKSLPRLPPKKITKPPSTAVALVPAKVVPPKGLPRFVDDDSVDDDDDDDIKSVAPSRSISTRDIDANPPKIHDHDGDPNKDQAIADRNNSVFRKQLTRLRSTMETHEYGEQAMLSLYKSLLDTVMDLIPIAEDNYRKFKIDRSAYALNTYLNQARQIANDIRAIRDFESQAIKLIEMSRSQFISIAQNFVSEMENVQRKVRPLVPEANRDQVRAALDEMLYSQGRFLNESSKQLSARIMDFMTEKPEQTINVPAGNRG